MEYILLDRENYLQYVEAVVELNNITFTSSLCKKEEYVHRYFANPFEDILVALAIDNNKVVGHYAVVPARYKHGDKTGKCALSLNTMTSPEYKGRNIFTDLADLVYKKAETSGYDFVYGFPNYISNGIFVSKLGWQVVYEIPTLEIEKDILTERLQKVRNMPLESEENDRFSILKDDKYVKWRYTDYVGRDYKTITIDGDNWLTAKKYEDIANVAEIHFESTNALAQLFELLLSDSKFKDASKITLWCNVFSKKHLCFERLGFRNKYPITYFGMKILNEKFECPDYRKWEVQLGDDNVY